MRAVEIPATSVVVAEWVSWKCRYGCPDYGRVRTCPPYAPAPERTRELLLGYERALLVEARRSHTVRYLASALEREAFLAGFYKALGLGAGPCRLCEECRPEAPCARPEEARPSMEACGIDVFATVRANGLEVETLTEPGRVQRSFGLVLLE